VPACPVCGDRSRASLHADLTDRMFGAVPGTWNLWRCRGCGSGYLDPRPTPESIGRAYETYYTHQDDGAAPPPPGVGALRRGLANDYLHARWGYEVEPVVRGGRWIGRVAPLRGASVGREIRHLPARPGGRLLDVGCGDGAAVAQMKRLGWDAEGLDPDPAAVEHANGAGLPVTQGTLADIDDEAHVARYDAITLSHVIEHVHDPATELKRVARLLKPGGRLWIATPNLDGLGRRLFGPDWAGLDPPRHLVLFTVPSLHGLIRAAGLEPQRTPTPAPLAWLIFSPSGALRDGRHFTAGPASGRRRLRALAAIANWAAARDPRHADELIAVAVRPA